MKLQQFYPLMTIFLCLFGMVSNAFSQDSDGDGVSDSNEVVAGTDINDPYHRPYWSIVLYGQSQDGMFGSKINVVGDINNDGVEDFSVSTKDDGSSLANIFSGKDAKVLATYYDLEADAASTVSIHAAGDVDQDGFSDFIVNRQGVNSTTSCVDPLSTPFLGYDLYCKDYIRTGGTPSKLSVVSGKTRLEIYSIHGTNLDRLGASVQLVNDVDGDLIRDFVLSNPGFKGSPVCLNYSVYGGNYSSVFAYSCTQSGGYDEATSGEVLVYSGSNGSLIRKQSDPAWQNINLSTLEDMNGDSFPEIIVGAFSFNSWASVLSGFDWSSLFEIGKVSTAEFNFNYFGRGMSSAGDVNNDGVPDFILGGSNAANEGGSFQVLSGVDGLSIHRLSSGDPSADFARDVAAIGDINEDGFDDFVVSASSFGIASNGHGKAGTVYIYSGKDLSVLYELVGDGGRSMFGKKLTTADIDRDGVMDLLVGSPEYSDDIFGKRGMVKVFLGKDLKADSNLDFILDFSVLDSDADGVFDINDAFPFDPSEQVDSDLDGVGDNADAFPNDATETTDSDGDGTGNNSDTFPNDPSESADSDGDGVGDNADVYPNSAQASSLKTYDGGGSLPFGLIVILSGIFLYRVRRVA